MGDHPSFARLALEHTLNTARRARLVGDLPPPAVTVPLGLAVQGAEAGERLAGRCAESVRRATPLVSRVIASARSRGEAAFDAVTPEATARFREELDDSVARATRALLDGPLGRVVRQSARTLAPDLIDAAMPHIRSTVVPAIIGDLTEDPRLRTLLTEQGHGVMTSMFEEVQAKAAGADDRVDKALRSLRRGGSPT